MNEIERYAGLTISDKPALLDAKSIGEEWVVFYKSGSKEFYTKFPIIKNAAYTMRVDEALAQIEEMENAAGNPAMEIPVSGNPLTWNDRINQMTVEEKAEWFMNEQCQMHNEAARYAWEKPDEFAERYKEKMAELLNRPYEEATDD